MLPFFESSSIFNNKTMGHESCKMWAFLYSCLVTGYSSAQLFFPEPLTLVSHKLSFQNLFYPQMPRDVLAVSGLCVVLPTELSQTRSPEQRGGGAQSSPTLIMLSEALSFSSALDTLEDQWLWVQWSGVRPRYQDGYKLCMTPLQRLIMAPSLA